MRLLQENGRAHFMTRRFDREVVKRADDPNINVQTLCGNGFIWTSSRAGTHAYAPALHGCFHSLVWAMRHWKDLSAAWPSM